MTAQFNLGINGFGEEQLLPASFCRATASIYSKKWSRRLVPKILRRKREDDKRQKQIGFGLGIRSFLLTSGNIRHRHRLANLVYSAREGHSGKHNY